MPVFDSDSSSSGSSCFHRITSPYRSATISSHLSIQMPCSTQHFLAIFPAFLPRVPPRGIRPCQCVRGSTFQINLISSSLWAKNCSLGRDAARSLISWYRCRSLRRCSSLRTPGLADRVFVPDRFNICSGRDRIAASYLAYPVHPRPHRHLPR